MEKGKLIKSLRNYKFSEKIIKAFEKVSRENFIQKEYKKYAYKDIPLDIGKGQTISQPYTIAFMLSLLELEDNKKILEVGSGSGYVLALINEISKNSELYGIERIRELANNSKKILQDKNINIICADGSKGLPEKAPFDRILVSASAEKIPEKLVKQLKIGGILVAPIRNKIIYLKKFADRNKIKEFYGFSFVPLLKG